MKIQVEVPDETVIDALNAAFEYGSTYWCEYKSGRIRNTVLEQDGVIKFRDLEEEKQGQFEYSNIVSGLTMMAKNSPSHFAALVGYNADAITYDVLLQYCIFSQIIYG